LADSATTCGVSHDDDEMEDAAEILDLVKDEARVVG
jgi:hypothetical protein